MKICYQCFKQFDSEYAICPYCGQTECRSVSEPQYLRPGAVLQSRYLIGIVIGAGGFGTTYAAWDKTLNQKVAIKEFLPGEFSTRMPGQTQVTVYGGEKTEQFTTGKKKFCDESKKLARFQEIPGIVHIYNSFEENGTAYIVMEYLEGETLAKRLKREMKIPEQEAILIMMPILQALETVHKEGILHRDIAPNNIFLTRDGQVKLLDFGAARSVTGTHSKSLTVLYKEGYTPEEQYRSRGDQGTWTDVYACAATLYHMLTGKIPAGALERRRKDNLKVPSKAGAKVSANVDKAVMNALNVDIRYRTRTAGEFLMELTGEVRAKEHFVRTIERKVGRIPILVRVLSSAVVIGIIIFFSLLMTGIIHVQISNFKDFDVPEGKVRIPNFIGKNIIEAEKVAEREGINISVVDTQFSSEMKNGTVLKQSLESGKIVESHVVVEIIICEKINVEREVANIDEIYMDIQDNLFNYTEVDKGRNDLLIYEKEETIRKVILNKECYRIVDYGISLMGYGVEFYYDENESLVMTVAYNQFGEEYRFYIYDGAYCIRYVDEIGNVYDYENTTDPRKVHKTGELCLVGQNVLVWAKVN